MKYNLITILGPTAVGKTKLAARLAHRFNGEIISADSRQVYKGMDIGTGKDLDDYQINSATIPYHLINVVTPHEEFNLFEFTELFNKSFKDITAREKIPFLVGGTGLYLNSILSKYNLAETDFDSQRAEELRELSVSELQSILQNKKNKLHNTTDLIEKERIVRAILIEEAVPVAKSSFNINSLNIGIRLPREEIKSRISARLKQRLKEGMIEEVENLLKEGVSHRKLQFFGLEYKFISMYLKGELNYNDMYQKLNSAIHQFAKRQMTWFRKMEREGIKINWIDGQDYEDAEKLIRAEYNDS